MPSGPATGRFRVFVIEDHELMRRALREVLEGQEDLELVGESDSEHEGVRRVEAVDPDVVVVDIGLAEGDGIGVCRALSESRPEMKCLVLTSERDEETLFDAIEAGAAGFVFKDTRADDLVDAIRKVARGESVLDPAAVRQVLTRLRSRPARSTDVLATLTDRERDLLGLLAEGLTNREIGERLIIAEQTVKNQLSALFQKLGVERRSQAAVLGARLHVGPPK